MKILIEAGDLNPPFVEGTKNIVKEYISELLKRNYEIIILTRRKETNTLKKFPIYEKVGRKTYYRWSNYFDLIWCLRKIKKENVNLVHIFAKGLRPIPYLRALKTFLRTPIFFTLLGYPFWNESSRKLFSRFIGEIDFLSVSSNTVYNLLKKEAPEKIKFIPIGVNLKKFKPFGVRNSEISLVCLKIPEKNFLRAYRKLSLLKPKKYRLFLDKKLSLNVDYPYDSDKSINRIDFLPNIEKLLGKSNILIELHPVKKYLDCASPPLLMIEAMACGMKILSTDIPEISEVIENGKEGLLIKNNSSKEIYSALINLSKIDNMGKRARKKINKKYNLAKIVSTYLALYTSKIDKI